MKLRSRRRTALVLTIAVDMRRVLFSFFTGEKTYPLRIAQGNISAQRYSESIITITEKVVNLKWGGI